MVRQAHLIAVVGVLLIACVVVGCGGSGGRGNIDGHDDERGDGERGSAVTTEETMAPEEDRPASGVAREQVGLEVEVVSPGGAYLPAGFGEGSLWATDPLICEDGASCALSNRTLLKRLDPRTGEEVAAVPLENFPTNTTEVVVVAGSVWVSSASGEAGAVLRVDPETNWVVERISVPADSPTGLAFGHGSVWITSSGHGMVSRVDPQTGEVAAKIEIGRGAVDIAADESSGDVWVASVSEDRKQLSRVDPATNRVVAEIPIAAHSRYGGAQNVAVGEGAVWAQSGDGRLFKVDPATNEVVAVVPLGEYSSDLAVYGGAVWATAQPSS